MSGNPYENEPGFEDANEPTDKKNQADYVQKVRPLGRLSAEAVTNHAYRFATRHSGSQ
jgi:hypothetical protein